jgi:hypothetical protein
MSEPRPLSLSDEQLTAVMGAARPLEPWARRAFLEAVAKQLHGTVEPGDGDVYRAIKETQRKFYDPPILTAGPLLVHKERRGAGDKVQA